MKTRIEEAAREFGFRSYQYGYHQVESHRGFIAGAEFMQEGVEKKNIEIAGYSKDLNNYIQDHGSLLIQKAKLEAQLEKAKDNVKDLITVIDSLHAMDEVCHLDHNFEILKKAREYFESKEV